jgi:acyl-coenzyme A synthetase/AMP-(fatty) acid ligase
MVKGDTLFKGYWNAHDMLNGTVLDGWWWTGDITFRDRWGRFYHLDRAADMIPKRNGIVYTLLMEEKLLTHPQVGEAVVIGLPTREKEMASVAIIHCKPGKTINKEDFLTWANEKLEPGMGLTETIVVEPNDIPRGLTGKVLKRILRERYATMLIPSEISVSPSNS